MHANLGLKAGEAILMQVTPDVVREVALSSDYQIRGDGDNNYGIAICQE